MTKEILKQALEALESDNPYLRQLAANEAAAKALYETWHSQPGYLPWQDGGNSLKQDEARELVRPPLPEQEDFCFCHDGVSLQIVSGGAAPEGYLGKVTLLIDGKYVDYVKAQRKLLTDDVLVPLEILEAAANSLDSFCGNLGWGDADLQNMDNLFAVIEQHKAAHNIKEKTCLT